MTSIQSVVSLLSIAQPTRPVFVTGSGVTVMEPHKATNPLAMTLALAPVNADTDVNIRDCPICFHTSATCYVQRIQGVDRLHTK